MKTRKQKVKFYTISYTDSRGFIQYKRCWTKKKRDRLLRTVCGSWFRWTLETAYQFNWEHVDRAGSILKVVVRS